MRQNVHKAAALLTELAPWFALQHYESLRTATPIDWFNQIALRIDLQRMRRSLAIGSADPAFRHWTTIHSCMVSLVREGVVTQGTITDIIQEYEVLLAPEGFSTLSFLQVHGRYIRLLTMIDFLRIHDALPADSLDRAAIAAGPQCARGEYPLPAVPLYNADAEILYDPVVSHMRGLFGRSQSFVAFDLQMPKSVLVKRFEQLVDHLQSSSLPLSPCAERSAKPTYKAWEKSRVLPYIDLCQWRDSLNSDDVRRRFTNVAIASALEMDPDTLKKVTMGHAEELTDDRSWTFMQLVEDAISFHSK